VPQDDIVHPNSPSSRRSTFLPLRTDLTDTEIEARTRKVLEDLDIYDKAKLVIGSPQRKTLSGGQRKRVNIALELITTRRSCSRRADSGLSSYDAESVVDLLKGLSRAGKTIVATVHQPSLKSTNSSTTSFMVSRDKGPNGEHRAGAMVYFGPAYPDSMSSSILLWPLQPPLQQPQFHQPSRRRNLFQRCCSRA